MQVKNKNLLYILAMIAFLLVGSFFWFSLRTVEIFAVHENDNFSDVLVKEFPLTDHGKINWWLNNKAMLKERFNIPKPASYGSFTITFWDFGNGYQEEGKYDRLCFDDMKTKNNCIDKNPLFSVRQIKNDRLLFITYDGRYSLNDKGEVVKIKREYD
ncbi:Enterobacterial putative membrane protein (DUF943) [Serratia rubidaea]|uniref:DUF943 family protein n=1 Tax=Serratia rubidaea TaxID=61652 RepID=UPI0006C75B7B|nr:DUF943 family protein [Serratia rubidaea]QPR61520.1 DUF943 family protein [Serratia rubidaea]CAI1158196.1 Enterobacterial putative membrane protein (DUF943) [Serratia rubidaea]CAI1973442.1 Enterobacterial putative membrane protein (DUF943) [Serratia rubidaea]HAY0639329.1 DUF943 family protein [Serratia rubidaea]HAY0639772.1 DUF943 family protein [Serratia rubidaea]